MTSENDVDLLGRIIASGEVVGAHPGGDDRFWWSDELDHGCWLNPGDVVMRYGSEIYVIHSPRKV
jgi:hypothetical protein